MESEITELLEVLHVVLKTIETSLGEDFPNLSLDVRKKFLDIQLNFDCVSKLFSYQQFNSQDYLRAVNIVKGVMAGLKMPSSHRCETVQLFFIGFSSKINF